MNVAYAGELGVVAMVRAMTSEGVPLLRSYPRSPESEAEGSDPGLSHAEAHCSLDPMRETDRYRLVTPYLSPIQTGDAV